MSVVEVGTFRRAESWAVAHGAGSELRVSWTPSKVEPPKVVGHQVDTKAPPGAHQSGGHPPWKHHEKYII